MLRKKLADIFHKAQQSAACHQKYRQILINLYNETAFEDFEAEFMRCLERIFMQDAQHKNPYVDRSLQFAATFITTVVQVAENGKESNDSDNVQTHPLLESMIDNVLQYHNLEYISARYRSCQFINLLLRNLSDDAHIDVDIGNAIQVSMLDRLEDIKPNIRLQAVKALARLQQPENSDCPVVKALLSHMYETNPQVRKEIVEALAATPAIVPKLVERVRDCDHTVRLAAYRKCSQLGPKLITISSRQLIVESGFNEQHELVRRCFLEDTLPKWLSAYNGHFIRLIEALKLDAYEEDLKRTETIAKKVLEVFFKSQQLSSIVEFLPIDENKLIPLDKLTTQSVLYWSILRNYLRISENTEDYVDDIIPELVVFCSYLETVFKQYNLRNLKDWQYLEYQQILCQLFQIVSQYDLGEEVGRRTLHKLVADMFLTGKFSSAVITEMIAILEKINPVLDSLTIDICHIISDIREPLIEQPPSEEAMRQHNFKMAELRVKINILREETDEAVDKGEYETAATTKKQLTELTKKLEDMTVEFETAKTTVRTSQSDPETLCRCLDILIGVLSHPKLKTLTASLRSCKDEFLIPLMENDSSDVNQRVYKCIALCCTLDRQMTLENLKMMCTPIIVYRLLPNYDKPVILTSIAAVSDLLRLFGPEIFSGNGNETNATNISKRRLNGTRRLYALSQTEDLDSFDFDSIACEDVVDILLDMLDDENQDLREQAGRALCELVMSKIAVSPSLMSRMILKWFSPVTERHDPKLQQLLSTTFVYFAQHVENSEEVLEKAVIPILTSMANAPRTSPLADIDTDNALRFLSAITCIEKQSGFVNSHKNLAYALLYKISAKPHNTSVVLYIRMLLNLELELVLEDPVIIRELIDQAQLVLEEVNEKISKRNMQKFVFKLSKLLSDIENQEKEPVEEMESVNASEAATVVQSIDEGESTVTSVSQQLNASRVSLQQQTNNESTRLSLLQQSSNSSRTSTVQQTTIPEQKSSNEPLKEQDKENDTPNNQDDLNEKSKKQNKKNNAPKTKDDLNKPKKQTKENDVPNRKEPSKGQDNKNDRPNNQDDLNEKSKKQNKNNNAPKTKDHLNKPKKQTKENDVPNRKEPSKGQDNKNHRPNNQDDLNEKSKKQNKKNNAPKTKDHLNKPSKQQSKEDDVPNKKDNKRKSDSPRNNNTDEISKSTKKMSNMSLKETPVPKKRKLRERKSTRLTFNKSQEQSEEEEEETILHTIIENDEHEMGSLEDDDLSIQTPTTSPSNSSRSSTGRILRPRKTPSFDTSSESQATDTSLRRSARKRKPSKIYWAS